MFQFWLFLEAFLKFFFPIIYFFQQQQYQVRAPHTSPQPPQLSPVTSNIVQRPQWSGETHPALAQVPRTPQQLQHLQRLQMQREQQQQMSPGQQMVRPPVPCSVAQQQVQPGLPG